MWPGPMSMGADPRFVEGAIVAYEPKRSLVVVKTYPNPNQGHGHTVCCVVLLNIRSRRLRGYVEADNVCVATT